MFAGFLKLITYKKWIWKRALNNSKLSKYSVFEVKTLHFFGESVKSHALQLLKCALILAIRIGTTFMLMSTVLTFQQLTSWFRSFILSNLLKINLFRSTKMSKFNFVMNC